MPITESPRFTSGHCLATRRFPRSMGNQHLDARRNQSTQSLPWHDARARARRREFDLRRNTSQSNQTGKSCLLRSNMAGKPRTRARRHARRRAEGSAPVGRPFCCSQDVLFHGLISPVNKSLDGPGEQRREKNVQCVHIECFW